MNTFGEGGDRRVGEFEQRHCNCREGIQCIAHPTEFAWVAQTVLQAAENALQITDATQLRLQLCG